MNTRSAETLLYTNGCMCLYTGVFFVVDEKGNNSVGAWMVVQKAISKKEAFELYGRFRLGAVYLVRNRDGSVYFVDHGYQGEIVKTEDRWEDTVLGFSENVFIPVNARYKFEIVAWEDEKPLDIYRYLCQSGWLDDNSLMKMFGY